MDPLLAGITLGSFVKDLVELVQNIKNSIDKVGENKERLSKLRDDVVGTLNGLAQLANGYEDRKPSPELLAALERLKSHLLRIQDKCQKQASRQRTSRIHGVDGMKSWWKRNKIEAEVKRLNECWSDCRTEFMLFSTARTEMGTAQIVARAARIEDSAVQIVDTTARIEASTVQSAGTIGRVEERTIQITDTAARIEERTAQIGGNTVQLQASELEQKLEKWLQYPPDMKKKQDDTQELHHKGTGRWFFGGPRFGKWKEKPGCLWIRGNSGTGKSVLSSTVIRKLFNDRAEEAAIAYFYFDFRNERSQRVKIMLHSIVLQLSAQSPNPYSALDRLYKSSKGQTLPTYKDLLGVLDKLLSEFEDTYIVLDALDECSESDRLVEFISRLQDWTKQSLHLLFTSQPREIFTNSKAFVYASLVVLSPNITEDDIKLFIDSELHKLSHLKRRAEEIAAKLVIKSNGMFRLAACLLIELRDAFEPDLDGILVSLPDNLSEVYSRFLNRVHPTTSKRIYPTTLVYVLTVLRWLCFSNRPLTLLELEDALAFDFSDSFVYDPMRRGQNADWVCKTLEGMVTVGRWNSDNRGQKFYRPGRLVSLAHASVADYLMSDTFAQEYTAYDLRPGPSHRFLAQTCLGYLLHFADYPLTKKTRPDYPLGLYAASSWYHHLRQSDDPALLTALAMRLLQDGSSQYYAFNTFQQNRTFLQPLCLCSNWGYTEGVRLLLESGADPNIDDGVFTALELASNKGHIMVVRLLLENGADMNAAGRFQQTPLYSASEDGRPEIVRLLLENGADVNAVGGDFSSALQAASRRGYTNIVRLLLENGADVNAVGGDFGSALQAASWRGYTDIVRLLLENGADVNAVGGNFGSALRAASKEGYIDIVRLLLENGADVNAVGGDFGSALRAASREGYTDIVRLLLEKGADVNTRDGQYGSALKTASEMGYTETVRVLLENGADGNALGGEFGSALQAASMGGHTDIIRLLLENGADVNGRGGRYNSALQVASLGGHPETVRLLLENGADVNTADGEYGSVLKAACRWGHTKIVHLLLENGAEVNAAGGKYGSALYIATSKGHTEIVDLLLENGAEVNAAGGEYGSALEAASHANHIQTVDLLLKHGADVNAAGGEYGNALYVASTEGHIETVCLLLEKGADANAAGGEYGSALQAASRWGETEIIHLLLENGADVNVGGGSYGSALQVACLCGHPETVRLLIEKGADVNVGGGRYGSALQVACLCGHPETVRLLIEKGADLNARGGPYGSALEVASWLANSDERKSDAGKKIVQILRENGAHAENTAKRRRRNYTGAVLQSE